ncbi:MAG: IS5 family transposase [Nanoarchaeota archaeon]
MKRKRWGKKYIDKRDWKVYNRKLVKRGEFYINPRFLDRWNDEIKEMNNGKEGNPYLYPDSMIEFLVALHSKSFDYRALEGIMWGLSPHFHNFPVISYSQICRRINKLDVNFESGDDNLIVGTDGSGIKVSNRGDWMRNKWQVKKGWIKVVIMGDTKGNIVDVRVGNEDTNEVKSSRGMIRKHKKCIKKLLGDGLYDCEENFDLCEEAGIEPVLKIRENASEKGLGPRAEEVRLYKILGYKEWAKQKGYGMRWICTEGIFSATKRIFGEYVRATKKRNMYHEAKLKFWAYNQLNLL